ncbi:hypothetical protein [Ruania alba]|uniref:Uncharacterized protein n=1 Tax=Ruania alba TaxID=648782 RepID=A0A1H5N8G1_9MICO|nr:hypothetical protein [Ruania alba]SEE97157.1 hypothetical protein SAMN04488554_3994 [Ruania alba]
MSPTGADDDRVNELAERLDLVSSVAHTALSWATVAGLACAGLVPMWTYNPASPDVPDGASLVWLPTYFALGDGDGTLLGAIAWIVLGALVCAILVASFYRRPPRWLRLTGAGSFTVLILASPLLLVVGAEEDLGWGILFLAVALFLFGILMWSPTVARLRT